MGASDRVRTPQWGALHNGGLCNASAIAGLTRLIDIGNIIGLNERYGFLYKYTAPEFVALLSDWFPLMPIALLSSPIAPTTIVSPLIATEQPKQSVESVFDAFR